MTIILVLGLVSNTLMGTVFMVIGLSSFKTNIIFNTVNYQNFYFTLGYDLVIFVLAFYFIECVVVH